MIKTEFWDDQKLAIISRDARLTYIALWNFSDDYGVVKGHHAWLKNNIYPYDEKLGIDTFKKWLLELETLKRILPFSQNGELYYYLPKFLTHQTINRPSLQRNPGPPDNILEDSCGTHGVLIDEVKLSISKEEVKENIYSRVVYYLNEKVGKNFKPTSNETIRLIKARLNSGFTEQDFYTVIDNKSKWLTDPKMVEYLRPQTLFGTKFESYLQDIPRDLQTKQLQPTTYAQAQDAKRRQRAAWLLKEMQNDNDEDGGEGIDKAIPLLPSD